MYLECVTRRMNADVLAFCMCVVSRKMHVSLDVDGAWI